MSSPQRPQKPTPPNEEAERTYNTRKTKRKRAGKQTNRAKEHETNNPQVGQLEPTSTLDREEIDISTPAKISRNEKQQPRGNEPPAPNMLRADYAYRCRQIDSLRCAQLHGDKYFTLARAAYT